MNSYLPLLQPYPFEKLTQLKAGVKPNNAFNHIALSIGEPKHAPPEFVLKQFSENLHGVSHYAATKGTLELRQTISTWSKKRFNLKSLDEDTEILPVNGTREAIFAFTQAAVDTSKKNAKVLMPNPFYQIYEGATILAGAEPIFLNCDANTHYLPDFSAVDEQTWHDCQLLFLCTPGNPTGAVLSSQQLQEVIALADRYDFIIASDECYSELYFDEQSPPVGLLQACAELGRNDYARCVVFHSLSKRSNLPGLRSGFIAGDKKLIAPFLLYRTYHGCAMPIQTQMASIAAWSNEVHVVANRDAYREKFNHVIEILKDTLTISMPDAGFYLWPETSIDDEKFAQALFEEKNITVLPGSYLARDTNQGNPGKNRIRMALVAPLDECIEAANRIKAFIKEQ